MLKSHNLPHLWNLAKQEKRQAYFILQIHEINKSNAIFPNQTPA